MPAPKSDRVQYADQRQELIADTERWLSKHLPAQVDKGRKGGNRTPADKTHPAARGTHSRQIGSFVDPVVNENGELDDYHLRELVGRLCDVARRERTDLLIDMTDVRSVTPAFEKVIRSLARYLGERERKLFLIRPSNDACGRELLGEAPSLIRRIS